MVAKRKQQSWEKHEIFESGQTSLLGILTFIGTNFRITPKS